jgi:hypothetical protein
VESQKGENMGVGSLTQLDTIDVMGSINNRTSNQEETEKLASDTFTSTKDTFEKRKNSQCLQANVTAIIRLKRDLKYIEKIQSHEITLCNGLKVIIGRAHNKEFKKEFFKWRMLFDN